MSPSFLIALIITFTIIAIAIYSLLANNSTENTHNTRKSTIPHTEFTDTETESKNSEINKTFSPILSSTANKKNFHSKISIDTEEHNNILYRIGVILLIPTSFIVFLLTYGLILSNWSFSGLLYGLISSNWNLIDIIIQNYKYFSITPLLTGLAVGILYPITGIIVIKICELLRYISHFGEEEPWSQTKVIFLTSIWPIAFIFSIIIYPATSLMKLLFKMKK